jgi:hypothetical protein
LRLPGVEVGFRVQITVIARNRSSVLLPVTRDAAALGPGFLVPITGESGDDERAISPLYRSYVNPYGTFRLDMEKRLDREPEDLYRRDPAL